MVVETRKAGQREGRPLEVARRASWQERRSACRVERESKCWGARGELMVLDTVLLGIGNESSRAVVRREEEDPNASS